MARPTNKDMLISQGEENFEKLMGLVEALGDKKEGIFGFEDRDKNVRDVLAHLYEWHLMMQNWYTVGMRGEKPAIPGEGYKWQTLPALNLEIWKKYQAMSFDETLENLKRSHHEIMDLIKSHTDEELFTKKYYKWTGTTSLGAFLVSSAPSHYDWAMKKIKKYAKEISGN